MFPFKFTAFSSLHRILFPTEVFTAESGSTMCRVLASRRNQAQVQIPTGSASWIGVFLIYKSIGSNICAHLWAASDSRLLENLFLTCWIIQTLHKTQFCNICSILNLHQKKKNQNHIMWCVQSNSPVQPSTHIFLFPIISLPCSIPGARLY